MLKNDSITFFIYTLPRKVYEKKNIYLEQYNGIFSKIKKKYFSSTYFTHPSIISLTTSAIFFGECLTRSVV